MRESTLVAARASFENINQWLPYFRFLGLGLILGGIVLALRVINDSLQGVSQRVVANLPPGRRPPCPSLSFSAGYRLPCWTPVSQYF